MENIGLCLTMALMLEVQYRHSWQAIWMATSVTVAETDGKQRVV